MTEPDAPTILICTVGGSPQPIRTALERLRPDKVVFVVSRASEDTRSSRETVDSEEVATDGGPGLRHAEGCPDAVEVREVPADDPDAAFAILEAQISRLTGEGIVVADYTGGTKSMSGALFLAATAHEGTRLQFMRGERRNLERVEAGSEAPVELPVQLVGVARTFDLARALVGARDYGAALVTIDQTIKAGPNRGFTLPKAWRVRLNTWRSWLQIMDAWDRFNHGRAAQLYRQCHESGLRPAEALDDGGYAERLQVLVTDGGKPSFALVEDLWLNALRRADQGRFDDAVARCYRLVEAALQAEIKARFGLDTAAVPLDRIPVEMRADVRPRGYKDGPPTVELGLKQASDFLSIVAPASDIAKVLGERPAWQGQRNRSILAHGFTSLGVDQWKGVKAWFEERKEVLWEGPLGRPTASQLPAEIP